MSKGLEALKSMLLYIDEPTKRQFALQDYKVIEKELKALEIIKAKQVNAYDVINSVDYKHYLVLTKDYHKDWVLTQEEYDLLKGVLL